MKLLIEDSRLPEARRTVRPSGLSAKHANDWKTIFEIDDSLIDDIGDTELPSHLNRTKKVSTPKSPPTEKKTKKQSIDSNDELMPPSMIDEARKLIDP